MQIHEKIERARVKAGLTQDELAKKIGIKRSTYQYWEVKTPSLDKIKLVEKALNLPDNYFLTDNDEIIGDNINRITTKNMANNEKSGQGQPDWKEYALKMEDLAKSWEELSKNQKEFIGQINNYTSIVHAVQKTSEATFARLVAQEEVIVECLSELTKKPEKDLLKKIHSRMHEQIRDNLAEGKNVSLDK